MRCHSTVALSVSAAALAVLLPARGFAGDVKWALGPGADFSRYKTYQWLPTRALTKSGVVEDEPTTTPLLKEAVNRQLAGKGLMEVPMGGDLLVSTMILTESSAQLEALYFPIIPYDDGSNAIAVGRYNKQGTLAVNLIDASTKKSAWVGLCTKSIDNKPGGGVKKIPGAVADIFKKYPGKK
jgi:hypothetical protein